MYILFRSRRSGNLNIAGYLYSFTSFLASSWDLQYIHSSAYQLVRSCSHLLWSHIVEIFIPLPMGVAIADGCSRTLPTLLPTPCVVLYVLPRYLISNKSESQQHHSRRIMMRLPAVWAEWNCASPFYSGYHVSSCGWAKATMAKW